MGSVKDEKVKVDFCTTCRKNTEYTLRKQNIKKIIKGKEYTFGITMAVCSECGEEMSIPELIDKNIQEIEECIANSIKVKND